MLARGLATLLLLVALSACALAATVSKVVLALPRPLKAGEGTVLVVTCGVLRRGLSIEVTSETGLLIGTVSPYGIPSGREVGSYILPVPAEAVRDGKLSLRLRVTRSDGPARAPTAEEVKGLKLSITPPTP